MRWSDFESRQAGWPRHDAASAERAQPPASGNRLAPSFTGARAPFAETPVFGPLWSRNVISEESGGIMTGRSNTAMTAAAELTALGSAAAAGMVVWLLLARPLDVVDAVSGHDLAGLARLAFTTFQDLLMRLLELL
jgi:hypothetical protein